MPTYTSYFASVAAADAVAATLPAALIPNYLGASDDKKIAWLLQASRDVDNARKYQGRRYDPINQVNEFPRVAYETLSQFSQNFQTLPVIPGGGNVVWDYDNTAKAPVVPADVLAAVIYQADFIGGGGDEDVDSQFSGIREKRTGDLGVSYGSVPSAGSQTGLCRRSYQLTLRFALSSGRML